MDGIKPHKHEWLRLTCNGHLGLYGSPEAHVFTICKVKFGDEHKKVPLLPGEYK
jgi:hypothetical protein